MDCIIKKLISKENNLEMTFKLTLFFQVLSKFECVFNEKKTDTK